MAGQPAPRRTTWQGKRLALVADRVAAGAGMQDLWRVITVPLDPVLAPFERIQRVVLVVGIGALALAVLLGIVLSRGFARPVRALVKATGRIARGDYDARVEVAGRDELGVLARSFNEMAHGLMLKERYRGVLDKVVSRDIAEELLKGDIVLGGETRRVTTLFADVRGFTSLTEGMEPQRVIALLNEFMERASEAIDAEGGVVDKYVGDEVMALFGAPVARGDDAEAAVRAALRIRDAVAELNHERRARGEPAIGVGIGINSGPAVAGNMGSSGRLNYTVLGESVNVASRLCDVAGIGDIVVTAAVLEEIGGHVDAVSLGARALKGLSADVELFSVRGLRPRPAPAAGAAGVATALLAALTLLAAPAAAQRLPTLEELGVAWTSADGRWQVTPSGRLDLEGYLPGDAPPGLIRETDPFVGGRLSLLLDVFAGERVYGLLELRADRGEAPRDHGLEARVEQAFARVTPLQGRDLALQAGKFVSPFGGWPQRHHSAADPFVRPPLAYDYRTMVSARVVPGATAGFLDWKDDPATFRPVGAPPVWGAPYQLGAMVMGGWKGLAFRLAAMNSAPSSEPDEWNDLAAGHGPSLVAHLGWQLSPELRMGASYDRGAYLEDAAEGPFPAARGPEDYLQELWGFEAAFTRGGVEARAELLLDRWEVPNLADDPRDVSYYAEARVKLS
ncbi:MAG TPA: adenylate/guanylate cyclase domain-containing protein, partial [Longimicrobiaceae bacterium]|nr:adenylate/guanylate cyclase domain-containing protein [Longimicrobiaceae bacterium]